MGKREWGVTDPFQFPPNEFHFGLLQAVEPFLRIHMGLRDLRQNVKNNKFEGGKMRRDALDACVHLIGAQLAEFERACKDGELGFRPRHLEMIRQVEKFTTPTDLSFLPALTADNQEQKGFLLTCPSCLEADNDEVRVDGENRNESSPDAAVEHRVQGPTHSGEDQEGYHMDREAAPQGPKDVADKGRTDCRGFVFNERCVFVGEFKPDEDMNAIAQAAACARPEVRRNLSNRHYKAMHLLGLSRFMFTYAVLEVQGYIVTGGQYISSRAYEDFVATTEPGSSPDSKDVLDELFKSGTTFFCENYRAMSRPCYPKRQYIVGDLYVASSWYMLPTNVMYHGMISPEAAMFYEGLLRIVVGDRILKFTAADIVESVAVRMAESLRQTINGGLGLGRWATFVSGVHNRAMQLLGQPGVQELEDEEPDHPSKRARVRENLLTGQQKLPDVA